ncbi:carboxypeptidase-like regulatory domain-containing protein [Zobellia alginiliquefaciens]|uniref:carboxypeptidase-like regulatory domain-containing protein n=1 Tax=Zobellia alginiliquefaciens TaxID=3032586 RepID=UPI0023E40CEA|nr:carboxypeptidase-like regulatory domain-containing protein [Zobellia alginiliquefaciens]
MRFPFVALFFLIWQCTVWAQTSHSIEGEILSLRSKLSIVNAKVSLEGLMISSNSNDKGRFALSVPDAGEYILSIEATGYIVKRLPVSVTKERLDLGTLLLDQDLQIEQSDNLISLSDSELLDDEVSSNSSGLLRATRDLFLNRAAFDFGQAFFRVRGYDSQNGTVLLNGISMNKFYDGRPQWNNWGGMNDVTRNQQFTNGLEASDYTFGGILGNTNIDTRPSGLRPGTRLSSSFSNRTYAGRLMATYTSGVQKNGLVYSVSGSRRWAKQGYIDGTLYDAFSLFGAIEYQINEQHSLNATALWASNRRGRSSAITEEVFELAGKKYNPYWGEQDDKIRNSRERKIAEPIFMLNHYFNSEKFSLNTGMAYQFGTNSRSRLGYYKAPNPDPTYYRYLPSFYINSPVGANFISANTAKEGFLNSPQMDWNQIYTANSNGQAAYVLYDDVADDTQISVNTIGNLILTDRLLVDFGFTYKTMNSENYARINDLFGADFHLDIDPFSETLNDNTGQVEKTEGDIFNYKYLMDADQFETFAQLRYNQEKWSAFIGGKYMTTGYQREGLFGNDRYPNNSLGKGETISFSTYGVKSGFTYKVTERHWLSAHGAYMNRPPVLQNVFINPRENNSIVPNIQSETNSTLDLNYYLRLPKLTGRLTGFYTRFQNTTDVNFFFVDAGVGSDFVQEVLTGLDKLHMGTELGLEYQLSSAVKLTAVAAVGKYVYASDPNVAINFDTAGREEDLINLEGAVNLGVAKVKNYKLAQGPQQAYAIGIEYRDPKYWWVGATTNYLSNNYANISTLTRTRSFYLDPETNQPFPEATEENVSNALAQEPLDNFYLLNLVGGKSWLRKGKYISVFASVNNLFDAVYRTGGYEQSRNGNYGQFKQDNLSGTPSFAPKYWYGYGRTYFLNLAYSF